MHVSWRHTRVISWFQTRTGWGPVDTAAGIAADTGAAAPAGEPWASAAREPRGPCTAGDSQTPASCLRVPRSLKN